MTLDSYPLFAEAVGTTNFAIELFRSALLAPIGHSPSRGEILSALLLASWPGEAA